MRAILILVVLVLAGCSTPPVGPPPPPRGPAPAVNVPQPNDPRVAARQFVSVVQRMEPIAEQICREERRSNCDFIIVVDSRPGQPPNAFQTLDRFGRPVLAFNLALINSVRNEDELAFVMGHEAAHHIASHIDRQRANAELGAQVFAEAASAVFGSGNIDAIRAGRELGAAVGARSFNKDFELEADALGTIISFQAGYDPLRGAEFFNQLPDPKNRFLGTHPPNADRIATVQRVAATLER